MTGPQAQLHALDIPNDASITFGARRGARLGPTVPEEWQRKVLMDTRMINEDYSEDGYYCPIHTEILKDKPGVCNLCGMALCRVRPDEEEL